MSSASQADADKVESALEEKAERKLLQHKVDRAFCESLLHRFSVEVGRQVTTDTYYTCCAHFTDTLSKRGGK